MQVEKLIMWSVMSWVQLAFNLWAGKHFPALVCDLEIKVHWLIDWLKIDGWIGLCGATTFACCSTYLDLLHFCSAKRDTAWRLKRYLCRQQQHADPYLDRKTQTLILYSTTSSSYNCINQDCNIKMQTILILVKWHFKLTQRNWIIQISEKLQLCGFLKMGRHGAKMPKQDTWRQWQGNTQVHVNASFVRELPLLGDMKNLGFC